MGRNIPQYHNHNHINDHPLLSVSLLIACIAATTALVSFLCGSLSKKKPPGAPDETSPENQENPLSTPPKAESRGASPPPRPPELEESYNSCEGSKRSRHVVGPLQPPPARSSSCHVRSLSNPMIPDVAAASRKLDSSMSMRKSGPIMSRPAGNTKKLKHEDSIWKKPIILGEKCRLPDEEEAIVYNEKGRRIPTYHPRTKSNALDIWSRQNSTAEPPPASAAEVVIRP